ncbi:hypothetical protein TRVL_03076 [Trypanosoma vivax]|nr:hypothetical protein TRVL_03076 [Trypanosoma vivax]
MYDCKRILSCIGLLPLRDELPLLPTSSMCFILCPVLTCPVVIYIPIAPVTLTSRGEVVCTYSARDAAVLRTSVANANLGASLLSTVFSLDLPHSSTFACHKRKYRTRNTVVQRSFVYSPLTWSPLTITFCTPSFHAAPLHLCCRCCAIQILLVFIFMHCFSH